ncbi:MAG: type II secretory pathway, component PulD [Verrucomicrobiota bacterium]
MKRYLAARMRLTALLIAVVLAALTLVTPKLVEAQSAPDKIRLMADTLRARDSGNFVLAKEKAEELIKLAPDDENIQRLLISINRSLEGQPSAEAAYNQPLEESIDEAMSMPSPEPGPAPLSEAEELVAAATQDQEQRLAAAEVAIAESAQLAELGAYADANNLLNSAAASLPLNTATASTIEAVEDAKADVILAEARALAESGDVKGAEALVQDYRSAGGSSREAKSLARDLDRDISNPYALDINEISPQYVAQSMLVRDLLTRGRAQYLNGDYDGAQRTFKEVEARDANNAEAKLFQTRIAEILGEIHGQNFYKTREQMLTEVEQAWERPKVFDISVGNTEVVDEGGRIQDKLNAIVIPQVNFSGMELTRVIETLSELSLVYDPEQQGVNIIPLFNPNDNNPRVNISLRNLNLDRILQFVTQQVNFAYDVGGDAVTIQPSDRLDGNASSITEFFPISRATVIRLTGFRDGGGASAGPIDPFAAPVATSSGPSQNEETEALQNFFQSAGVNFELPGTSLAFDGEQLIVTQTRRNLERLRTILRNYNEVKQVEIEAKFLEVAQNDLDEVGFDWSINQNGETVAQFSPRSLSDAFDVDSAISSINVTRPEQIERDVFGSIVSQTPALDLQLPITPPSIPDALDFASDVSADTYSKTGIIGFDNYSVDMAIRALSRKSGSDLMSAPKVTVLSGKRANITVAQELRYPESYGDIESTASGGGGGNNNNNNSRSSISITAGTPQDFVTRNVGVELSVTPNVENDDTISLTLEPRVTEFEGFVEYGGPSVAIAGETTVTVPAGFFQPIFSTREISTEVTIFDGATIVMGGLTRDEIKSVNDKVPVLGDIPGVGRLFRSEGETRQKKNLLIFVTANLVSPGGSPARQSYRNVDANSLFQNPTIMTPSGSANRSIELEQ